MANAINGADQLIRMTRNAKHTFFDRLFLRCALRRNRATKCLPVILGSTRALICCKATQPHTPAALPYKCLQVLTIKEDCTERNTLLSPVECSNFDLLFTLRAPKR